MNSFSLSHHPKKTIKTFSHLSSMYQKVNDYLNYILNCLLLLLNMSYFLVNYIFNSLQNFVTSLTY